MQHFKYLADHEGEFIHADTLEELKDKLCSRHNDYCYGEVAIYELKTALKYKTTIELEEISDA